VLHSFGEGEDGFQAYGGLIIDASGNLYSTTTFVGAYNNKYGTVFELTPKAGGGWTEKVLYSFDNKNADRTDPQAGVFIDGSGNLNGTNTAAHAQPTASRFVHQVCGLNVGAASSRQF
jgi:hypothetical protein